MLKCRKLLVMREQLIMRFTVLCLLLASSCFVGLFSLFPVAEAQTPSPNVSTDPSEAAALTSVFERWGISASAQWNISGELCSGVATDTTDIQTLNPAIKCDCSDRNGTLCHITALKVYALNVAGPIPDELWNLTFLTDLNLAQNFLSGPLPPAIGSLTRMQYLTIGINALSGELPRELGNLTDLRSLGFSTNNFSGPLPSELGNLTRLTQIYFDSAGVSGPIPSTFARLQSLTTVWASDNALTGQIPDFIGSWLQLSSLRFQGNSFQGRIPPSFSNLTSLVDLRISDLSNGSSSLHFIRNMKSLYRLVLRNNNISGSIPPNIGQYQDLTLLDLSFNNLTGRIPDLLFNLSSLTHLFLGNNKLTGPLPAEKTSSLQAIDLSYNELSGSFPSWVSQRNLQLNLVANNFTISDSNSSGLPSGLNCLQRNFPCYRGPPFYSSFAIKCGGQTITSSDQIIYERDNETLGPATYYMTSTSRWAVSNVGLPLDSSNPQYTTLSLSQFTYTLDPELFQTARVSAGSLRYYGLGLENGNYIVNLQFAESAIIQFGESTILNPTNWRILRRRVFDVYIQGNRVLQDFDIWRETGGASIRAIRRTFRVRVSENYLEIHLFWAGKGTCCVPQQGTYGPSISAISAIHDFEPTAGSNTPSEERDRIGLIVGIVVPVGVLSLVAVFAAYYIVQRRKRKQTYDDEELKAATDDFNPASKLGEGGFGAVFKGTLGDGRVVAVKQLSVASRQGKSQFIAEIATISAVQHRNLVKLYGCCIEGDKRLLVYEYLENKSLDQALFGKTSLYLNWPTRLDICLGVARGLAYLHEESRLRIVHRDVKASNILLDSNFTPKISDFGLAKLYDDKKTHISTRVAGTFGYLAPEYALRGHLTEKVDVFGFGVVALEVVSGRPNSDPNLKEDEIYLLELAWQLHENNREIELLETGLSEFDEDEVKRVIGVALLCTQTSPGLRPSMSRVVAMLSGDIEVPAVTSRPGYLTDWKFGGTSSFMSYDAQRTDNDHHGSSSTTIITGPVYSLENTIKPTRITDPVYFPENTTKPMRITNPIYSLENASKPMLHEFIGEARRGMLHADEDNIRHRTAIF